MNGTLELAVTFATSALIGLLVGLERERNPCTKAGVRTFALIAVLGALSALLAQAADSGWIIGAAALAVGVAIAGAHFVDPATVADDSGSTTVIAALVVFSLGAIGGYGQVTLAVAVGIGMTALLHFKVELEGWARRLTPTDLRSILQFGAVSAVILPLLPDQAYGPYGVLNPFHIWLMVVLVSGVSLAGYVAWRLTLARKGLLLTGLLGGLVSSTATTLIYARHARAGTHSPAAALVVILLANATMFVRVLVVSLIVAPAVAALLAATLLPAVLLAGPAVAWRWRAAGGELSNGLDTYRSPTNLRAAIAFAAGYALVLLIAAWAAERIGTEGLYGLALVSGLTDVDAITLSVLQLFNTDSLMAPVAATAVTLAVAANLFLKTTLVWLAGGAALGRSTAMAFAAPLLGMAGGVLGLHWLAAS